MQADRFQGNEMIVDSITDSRVSGNERMSILEEKDQFSLGAIALVDGSSEFSRSVNLHFF